MTRTVLTLHRWLGLASGVLIVIAAATAIAINHRTLLRTAPPVNGPYGKYLLSVGIHPRDARDVWLGTSEGLFHSRDGGATFQEVTGAHKQVVAILHDPRDAARVLAIRRYDGIVATKDDGKTWQPLPLPENKMQVAGASFQPDGTLTVLTPGGIHTLSSTGWRHAAAPPTPPDPGRTMVQTIYNLHDGQFWGRWGVLVTDAASAAMILLTVSGTWLFFGRRKKKYA